jgi:hypothetical protein
MGFWRGWRKGRKRFFFEKKNQKTFDTLATAATPRIHEVFLLLFVHKKKNLT